MGSPPAFNFLETIPQISSPFLGIVSKKLKVLAHFYKDVVKQKTKFFVFLARYMPVFCLFLAKNLKINGDNAILIWVRMYSKMGFFARSL